MEIMQLLDDSNPTDDSAFDSSLGELDGWENLSAFGTDCFCDEIQLKSTFDFPSTVLVTNVATLKDEFANETRAVVDPIPCFSIDTGVSIPFTNIVELGFMIPSAEIPRLVNSVPMSPFRDAVPQHTSDPWFGLVPTVAETTACANTQLYGSCPLTWALATDVCEPRPLPICGSIASHLERTVVHVQPPALFLQANVAVTETPDDNAALKSPRHILPTKSSTQDVPRLCKPMRMYNHYFGDERDNILQGLEKEGDPLPPPVSDFSQKKLDQLLHRRWFIDPIKERRLHRKSHGKIDFLSLSREIASRWRAIPQSGRAFYQQVAQADQARYDELLMTPKVAESKLAR